MTMTSASFTQSRSLVRVMLSGRRRKSLVRSAMNCCIWGELARPYSVTVLPMESRYQVMVEPQRPQPITVTFIGLFSL